MVFSPYPVFAERLDDKKEWGSIGSYSSYYDAGTVDTFTGEVSEIIKIITARCRNCYCVAIDVKNKDIIRTVYLGPRSYIKRRNFQVSPGEKITVTGSMVTINGRDLILAQEVATAESLLALRDDQGHLLTTRGRKPDRAVDSQPVRTAAAATISETPREGLERAVP
jgi:hypothetical protein